jgi:hypothetical protein
MSSRLAMSRQAPLGPDEGFEELVARLIRTNRAEIAQREKAGRNGSAVRHDPVPRATDGPAPVLPPP